MSTHIKHSLNGTNRISRLEYPVSGWLLGSVVSDVVLFKSSQHPSLPKDSDGQKSLNFFLSYFISAQTPIFSKYTSKNKELLSNTAKIIIGVVGSFSFVVVLVVIAVLYRRKKLYGGFYILTLPPMPDYLKKLDPQRPIQEQTHKLPLCADWEFPRNRLTLGKITLLAMWDAM